MRVGQNFTFQRTFTDGDVAMFCGGTGDYNPYWQDAAFEEQSFYGRLTILGLLTGSMLTHRRPARLPRHGDVLRLRCAGLRGRHFASDTLSCAVTIAKKNEKKRRVTATAVFFIN